MKTSDFIHKRTFDNVFLMMQFCYKRYLTSDNSLLVYNDAAYDLMVVPNELRAFDTLELCNLLEISKEELLDNEKTILDNFNDLSVSMKQLRATLGSFLFTGDDVYKQVKVLSPGERSRVALAKLSLLGANFLILDEPTNHLDPQTQKIIAKTFSTFKGTMLVVSHNPEFVDSLGISRLLDLQTGEISYYDKNKVKHYEALNTQKN